MTNATQLNIAQPEPELTREKLLQRAVELRQTLRDRQEDSERRGWFGPETQDYLVKNGFYRVLQPRMFGGYEFDLETFIRIVLELASAHPSSAWCYSLSSVHSLVVSSLWPEEAQRALFGTSGELRAVQVRAPTGSLRKCDGGWMANGRWAFASGVPAATHFIGSAIADTQTARWRNFIVPAEGITIVPDWHDDASMGMRGSGSNTVTIRETFVPEANVILAPEPSQTDVNGTPGTRLHRNPMYLGLFPIVDSFEFAAIFVGTARAAFEAFESVVQAKGEQPMPLGTRKDPAVQLTCGEALSLIDAAEALLFVGVRRFTERCDQWAKNGTPITSEDTFRIWSLGRTASEMACSAVELLFRNSGASVCRRGRMSQYFADAQMYRIHVQARPQMLAMLGRAHFGMPLAPTPP